MPVDPGQPFRKLDQASITAPRGWSVGQVQRARRRPAHQLHLAGPHPAPAGVAAQRPSTSPARPAPRPARRRPRSSGSPCPLCGSIACAASPSSTTGPRLQQPSGGRANKPQRGDCGTAPIISVTASTCQPSAPEGSKTKNAQPGPVGVKRTPGRRAGRSSKESRCALQATGSIKRSQIIPP
jgi:hypothetical protein